MQPIYHFAYYLHFYSQFLFQRKQKKLEESKQVVVKSTCVSFNKPEFPHQTPVLHHFPCVAYLNVHTPTYTFK